MAKSDFILFGIPAVFFIYESVCPCGADYFGETIRNVKIRWNEHENKIDKNSECFKHLK